MNYKHYNNLCIIENNYGYTRISEFAKLYYIRNTVLSLVKFYNINVTTVL